MIAPFATLATYAAISRAANDDTVFVAKAFASLALVTLVSNPLVLFCQALPLLVQALSCFNRIQVCLLLNEGARAELSMSDSTSRLSMYELDTRISASDTLFVFEKASLSWSPDDTSSVLKDVDLSIRRGLTAIIGPVGSGKTTLLSSLVGETSTVGGSISSRPTKDAFCSQVPWILDDSIRCNIIGGFDSDFDEKWLDFPISSCVLQNNIDRMPVGDQTLAGSNGSALSGGQ